MNWESPALNIIELWGILWCSLLSNVRDARVPKRKKTGINPRSKGLLRVLFRLVRFVVVVVLVVGADHLEEVLLSSAWLADFITYG